MVEANQGPAKPKLNKVTLGGGGSRAIICATEDLYMGSDGELRRRPRNVIEAMLIASGQTAEDFARTVRETDFSALIDKQD